MKLTKTNFLIYLDCAKNAWLKIHKPDIYFAKPLSVFDQGVIETGNEVDVLARELFPNGVLVSDRDATEETMQLVEARTPVIYQPVFETELYKMVCDVIAWNEETQAYNLYEVKASNSGEDKKAKDKLYAQDIAFQYIVLQGVRIPIGRLYIVRLNAEYVRVGDLDIKALFSKEDFTERVLEITDGIREQMKNAYEVLSQEQEPVGPCKCITRGRSSHCTTFSYSNPDVPSYSVHDISRIGSSKRKLEELIDSGIFSIHDVPEDFPLSEKQRNQVTAIQTNKAFMDKDSIQEFGMKLQFPIAFLDYETFPSALPRFTGYGPFNQIPFQFSVHLLPEKGQEPLHKEFLFTENKNPDEAFIQSLQKHVPSNGSVIVWHKSFEMGRNKDLANRNPDYKVFLEDLNSRIIDLEDIFTEQHFVHPDFKGKTSIKYILPVLAPDLSYKALDIQEGATASDTWNKIALRNLDDEEIKEKIESLLTYCKLDTYAMYAIWRYLFENKNED